MAFRTNKTPVLQEKSASGSVASFNTALAMPLSSCNIAVNAWQEGSGDPSPSNVRPIHGFSEVNATRAGKNIKPNEGDNDTYQGVEVTYSSIDDTYTLNGTAISATTVALKLFSKLHWKIDTYYTISVTVISGDFVIPSGTGNTYAVTIGNNQFTRIIRGATSNTADKLNGYKGSGLSFNSNAYRLVFQVSRAGMVFNNLKIKIQIEAGSTATAYEPYVTPTIYTIQLGQEVYGAEVDVVNGVAHCTWNEKTVSELSFTAQSGNRFTATISDCVNTPNFTGFLCSTYKPILVNANNNTWLSNRVITIVDNRYTTATEFKEAMGDTQIVYPLAEPFDIQLTPTQIETLIGNNTIFADTGDVNLTYKDLDIAKRGNFREVFKLPS